MKLAIIGATGFVGKELVQEALRRGHSVTAIARHLDPEQVPRHPKLTAREADVRQPEALSQILVGHDAVLSSVRFLDSDADALIRGVKRAHVERLLVVGGAGSLQAAPGLDLIDAPGFPAEYKPEASAGREFLKRLRAENDLQWTFLSPSAHFVAGKRTGRFRLGGDELLTDAKGESRISTADYAIAMLDEVETPKHPRQRFTVGY